MYLVGDVKISEITKKSLNSLLLVIVVLVKVVIPKAFKDRLMWWISFAAEVLVLPLSIL